MDYNIKLISVCVEYDDLLALALPTWIPHVSQILIVTSKSDRKTEDLARNCGGKVSLHQTDSFYEDGAKFNKGKAIEEGFDVLGREGWILVADADILFPQTIHLPCLRVGTLYTPRRRILEKIPEKGEPFIINDDTAPIRRDMGHYGYFQLFHASSPQLERRPWYTTDWTHAGGADNDFQNKFAMTDKVWLDGFTVTHLGPCDENWFGRTTARVDNGTVHQEARHRMGMQESLKRKHGWDRPWTGEPLEERVKR